MNYYSKKEFDDKGYVVINDVLSKEEISLYKKKLASILDTQIAEFGSEKLSLINEESSVRCPLLYDNEFLSLFYNTTIDNIVNDILGKYYIMSLQNAIIIPPKKSHHQSFYHRDIIHQDFTSSKPLAVNIYFCLDEYSEETGGTTFIPGSHNMDVFPSVYKEETPVVDSGSVILFNSMIYHKAGSNNANTYRFGINHMFTLPFIKQQINLPLALKGKYKDVPNLNRILGYMTREYDDVLDFRNERLRKLAK